MGWPPRCGSLRGNGRIIEVVVVIELARWVRAGWHKHDWDRRCCVVVQSRNLW